MAFFKFSGSNASSKKNKTASAVNTPAQTPRTSIQLDASDLPAANKTQLLSHQNAVEMLLSKSALGHMQALSMARVIS
ncbi:hypothetical protein BGZ58_009229 [Dissophora ornata]|nr:hypothetical protein BGZ58_009229 [Dissophora ornata]